MVDSMIKTRLPVSPDKRQGHPDDAYQKKYVSREIHRHVQMRLDVGLELPKVLS